MMDWTEWLVAGILVTLVFGSYIVEHSLEVSITFLKKFGELAEWTKAALC